MFGCIGAGGELAVHGGFGEQPGVGHQQVDGIDTLVEVVLDGVEIAVVGVGDFGGNIALADAVDITGGDVERADDGIEGVIDTLDDLAEVALVFCCVGAGGELAVHGGFGEHGGVSHHGLDGFNHLFKTGSDFPHFVLAGDGDGVLQFAARDTSGHIGQLAGCPGDRTGLPDAENEAHQGNQNQQPDHPQLGGRVNIFHDICLVNGQGLVILDGLLNGCFQGGQLGGGVAIQKGNGFRIFIIITQNEGWGCSCFVSCPLGGNRIDHLLIRGIRDQVCLVICDQFVDLRIRGSHITFTEFAARIITCQNMLQFLAAVIINLGADLANGIDAGHSVAPDIISRLVNGVHLQQGKNPQTDCQSDDD